MPSSVVKYFLILSLLSGCQPEATSTTKQFENYSSTKTRIIPSSGMLKEADKIGVEYVIEQSEIEINQAYRKDQSPEENIIHRIYFKNLTKEKFNRLKEVYGGRSQMQYVEGQKYSLADVLSPFIQATEGKRFLSQQMILSENLKQEISNTVKQNLPNVNKVNFVNGDWEGAGDAFYAFQNCTGAAIEIARNSYQSFTVFSPPSPAKLLTNEYYFETIQKDSSTLQNFIAKYSNSLKPYDIITVNQNDFTEDNDYHHTMVYIDNGVVFEKTNPDSNSPYKFMLFQEMNNEEYKISVFRKKSPIPHPSEFFSVENTYPTDKKNSELKGYTASHRKGAANAVYMQISPLYEVELVFDPQGRASPHARHFEFETLGGKKYW